MRNTEITIHTDGSCRGNPGRGGWAAVVRRYEDGNEIKKRPVCGSVTHTTNNRMEMTAAIKGIRQIRRDEKAQITVYSDSRLLIQGMTKWVPKWQTNGWRNAGGKPVENRDLWGELLAASDGLNVQWEWVRGHAGDPRNEEVDGLAVAAANKVA
ncbi:ribonuclease HI [Ruegeria sp. Ofav3-42]|uniref:ribonuclease HI n=1 Tax=Ruegeria sp. Ofav3-42 TaxID=2917759 RepID=UPI001EF5B8EA|nr:ribonuclease HI [Ruegeria sp. Ofav3-42]MCG7520504.1 ribonuclease HI [Ruegeria sp. Ofav3-42]